MANGRISCQSEQLQVIFFPLTVVGSVQALVYLVIGNTPNLFCLIQVA